MKKPGDVGANPTMQIDLADLDDARLEALVTSGDPSERPPAGRAVPPPLPASAVVPQSPPRSEAKPARRSNLIFVLALVGCLALGFAVVAVLRSRSSQPTAPAAKPTNSVLTIPTVDMSDDSPSGR